jgi:hypothetical protein
MALKPKTTARITKAMKRFVAWLKYRSVGPHALSRAELKDLVRSNLITPTQASKTAVARAYLTTHAESAIKVAPQPTRDHAIDFLERMFTRYADKVAEQFTTDILNQLEAQLMPFADRTEGQAVYGLLRDKDQHHKYLGNALKESVDQWSNRWKLIVNTELARASNYGALDAILHNNQGKEPGEIVVYKIGPRDGAVCDECRRFWYLEDFQTPRVYRLSELLANGTNIGRKRRDWKPTIDNTHPNERHLVLQELTSGWGFRGGMVSFVSKDHDEYLAQRSKR